MPSETEKITMSKDIWHYPRTALAKQILEMFESGLSNALVFFAPRRMGKSAWERCTTLEKLLIKAITNNERELFSQQKRKEFAKLMGIKELPVSTVQSAIRTLQKKQIIGSLPERGEYFIDDLNFKRWLIYSNFFYDN